MQSALTSEFPQLSSASREDLEDLLNDHAYFRAIFHSLPQVKALYQSQAELGDANEALASNAVALQDPLYNLRSETKDAFDEAKALEARWKELDKEQRDVYQRFNPQFLLMRLRHSTTAQDEASEALAAAFIRQEPTTSGPGSGTATPNSSSGASRDVENFVQEFREMRTTYHKRVLYGDKWTSGQVEWRED